MKNSSEIIRTIKLLLGIEVKLESMTLDNGTTIEAEVFEAGQEIFILTSSEDEGAQAEKVPMPEGEYTLENGQKLVVNAESLIESIGEAEAEQEEETPEAEPEAEQEMESETPESTPKKVVKSISEEVHFQAIAKKDEEIAELKAQIVELSKEDKAEEESEEQGSEVEMEAEETPDVIHNPEGTPEKVKFSSVQKPQSKRQSIYDKLYG